MCTVIIFNNAHYQVPLVIAANRDEALTRPSEGPSASWNDEETKRHRVLAGKDLLRGGTWLGITDDGFYCAITNQDAGDIIDPNERFLSRGDLVRNILTLGETQAAENYLARAIHPESYRPFNIVFGNEFESRVATNWEASKRCLVERIPDGVFVLTNDYKWKHLYSKAEKVFDRSQVAKGIPWTGAVGYIKGTLMNHDLSPGIKDPYQATCVHSGEFGTVSSTIIGVSKKQVITYLHASGPPCQTAYEEHKNLFSGL